MVFLSLLLSLASCELLFSSLHGRENIHDEQAQVFNTHGLQRSIGEVDAGFGWKGLPRWNDGEEEVVEVLVMYGFGSPPPTKTLAAMPQSNGGKLFAKEEGTCAYRWSLNAFEAGDEVWFAFYPRTEDAWLAAMYDKVTVKSAEDFEAVGPENLLPVRGFTGDAYGTEAWVSGELTSGDSYDIDRITTSEEYFLILQFDLPDKVWCTEALLTLTPLTAGTTGTGSANAVSIVNIDQYSDYNVFDYFDFTHESTFNFTDAETGSADITEAVNAAILLGSDTLAIRAATLGEGDTFNYDGEALTISYEK
ncbi:MAG: hypothetical protein ACLFNZ_02090 [Spirochaetaceae bacterium]